MPYIETIYPLFTQRGGARRGGFNYTWPLERLSVYEDKLILSETKILKENIKTLTKYREILSLGLKIERKSTDETLIFWTFNYRALTSALKKAGYAVEE